MIDMGVGIQTGCQHELHCILHMPCSIGLVGLEVGCL